MLRASTAALKHVLLNNGLRRSHKASSSQDGPLSNPIACRAPTVVVPSVRSSRTRQMSSQMLGSPSVLTVTSWHPNPSIHAASERAACGSPPPHIETATANVMRVCPLQLAVVLSLR